MGTIAEKIAELEEELQKTKYNKRTQHHIGLVKAKIAKLKAGQEVAAKKSSHSGPSYAVRKTGDATVLFVGFPSVGKSTLLNQLTNAESKVAAYEFTTINVIPGLMQYKGAKIQLLDVPGIISGASEGKGRGREILSVVRNADLVLAMIDKPGQLKVIFDELYTANLRLNGRPPNVTIRKKISGGVHFVASCKLTHLTEKFAKDIFHEYGIHNADVVMRQDVTVDQLIDAITGNRKYVPALVVINKIDSLGKKEIAALQKEAAGSLPISAETAENLGALREEILKRLGIIRVYMKRIGAAPDYDEPLILKKNHTVLGACRKIRREWATRFQYAKVWGKSARFDGQTVGANHLLLDSDVLELHLKR
ncbi:MAG: GTP-binding protein [Candidatus Diapherotrites archaeon]|nr:GTP-binding protein [Candidatus Diapherotrites archaeon]